MLIWQRPEGKLLHIFEENGVGIIVEGQINGGLGDYSAQAKVIFAATVFGDNGADVAIGVSGGLDPDLIMGEPSLGLPSFGASVDPGIVLGDASDLAGTSVDMSLDAMLLNASLTKNMSQVASAYRGLRVAGVDYGMPLTEGGAHSVQLTIGRQFGYSEAAGGTFL